MAGAVFIVLGVMLSASQGRGASTSPGKMWVTAWGTSQQALADTRITNATVRMVARVTLPGDAIRVRLDNTFGVEPVAIGRATVGLRIQGAAVAAGSNRPLSFNGASNVDDSGGGKRVERSGAVGGPGAAGSGRQPVRARHEREAESAHGGRDHLVSKRRRQRRWRAKKAARPSRSRRRHSGG